MHRNARPRRAPPAWFAARFTARSAWRLSWLIAAAPGAWAQATDAGSAVVITATRIQARPFDVPASIDRVDDEAARDARWQVNLTEAVGGVPGLQARDRQNYAQDVQISIRGFGARSTFGIRGVRVYVDGIPATLPDGQGQLSHIDLGSADRIEVLRGPFSSLYGNSSGGVIQVFTEDGEGPPRLGASIAAGSDDARRVALRFAGGEGGFGYTLGASAFQTDGYRDHSAAERRLVNGKFGWDINAGNRVTLVVNRLDMPLAQDPLGLTRAQYETDPRGVDPVALTFDTRKTVDQGQAGLVYEGRLDNANELRLLVYGGRRNTEQFQAIPVATQAPATNPGGVISLARDYRGADLRWTTRATLAGGPLSLIAGLAWDDLDEHRLGYQNFVGTALGVKGALRRDDNNRVSNLDGYLQANWRPAPDWTINAGLRRSDVSFDSTDHYVVTGNPDDSGAARYGATLPVLGVMFAIDDTLHLYATAGRGYETPTLNELAYRPSGATGMNFALQPSTSRNLELGVKARVADWAEATLAVFQTRTEREIVVLSNVGGRAAYQNAGATGRTGVEAQASGRWLGDLRGQVALNWIAARYVDAFLTCTATPCATPNRLVAADNRIPGVAGSSLFASLGWAPAWGWRGGVEARWVGRVQVNDLNSDSASPYALAGAYAGYSARWAGLEWNAFVRADNIFARRYAGSVIVNEGNSRFFESAPERTYVAGLSARLAF